MSHAFQRDDFYLAACLLVIKELCQLCLLNNQNT